MRLPGRSAAVAASLTGVLLLAGCGGGADPTEPTGSASKRNGASDAPSTATGTLEQLAAKTDCKVNVEIDVDDLRRGMCTTKQGRFVLATFTTSKGQQSWLDEAMPYGGTYLVGKRWVAVGEPKVLGSVRGRLGGEVEEGESHTGGHSGEGHSDGDHSGEGHSDGDHSKEDSKQEDSKEGDPKGDSSKKDDDSSGGGKHEHHGS
ncbi:hypothetical protein QNO07_03030 [Streptomyces sp. 549]|uniref:hypothetical protein n=1 Tax=Streptomyces sp. 549 TaxID=3049076 RepID=UPI0024C2560C|nr:hypothetical protein [Streptomyces sp. 549]MDK1472408.1 hypothetical protein [Streptomyces sp. 549]